MFTSCHDIAEILLKVALHTVKSNEAKNVAPQCRSVAKSNHLLRVLQNIEIVITINYKLLYIYFQVDCILFYIKDLKQYNNLELRNKSRKPECGMGVLTWIGGY